MDYSNYEEYMRNVLGYYPQNSNIYENYNYRGQNYDNIYYRNDVENISEEEIEQWYPEIYRLVNPMVCKVCEANSMPITNELIEKMTDEVYNAIGDQETIVNVRIETPKEDSNNNIKREERTTKRENREVKINKENNVRNQEANENVETRAPRRPNSILRDLIKILILRQLLGNQRPPMRPPYPGGRPGMGNPRPPYPGRPGMGEQRPPYTREYENYLKF